MTKTIFLVRHAQGEHNIAHDFSIRDSRLTPQGIKQCKILRGAFLHHNKVEIIMASPLRRTIQTAIESFTPALLRPGVSLLLVPEAQEISAKPCDSGFEREELEVEMKQILEQEKTEREFDVEKIDYSVLEPGWSKNTGKFEPSLTAVEARAAALRIWLWQRPEKSIVLVTHGAFIHYLTEDWEGFVPENGTAYKNCEVRSFTFALESNETDAHLIEIGSIKPKISRPPGSHTLDISGADK